MSNSKRLDEGDDPGRAQTFVASANTIPEGSGRPVEVWIEDLEVDPALQCRVTKIDESTVAEYVAAAESVAELSDSWPFPPVNVIDVSDNGKIVRFLTDGFHRVEVAKRRGSQTITAIASWGTWDDVIRAAVGANASHGLRRTNDDKRKATELALETWPGESNREIARLVGVSHSYVNRIRRGEGGNVSTSSALSATASDDIGSGLSEDDFLGATTIASGGDRPAKRPATRPSSGPTFIELLVVAEKACGAFGRSLDTLGEHPDAVHLKPRFERLIREAAFLLHELRENGDQSAA